VALVLGHAGELRGAQRLRARPGGGGAHGYCTIRRTPATAEPPALIHASTCASATA
jgi:hypothetical protein